MSKQGEENQVPFAIAIDSEEINKRISRAVLESALGEKIKASVLEAVKELDAWSYNRNPIKEAIREEVTSLCISEVRTTAGEALRLKVREALEGQLTEDIISKAVERFLERF